MSEVRIEAVTIDEVTPHPNADRLDILKVGLYTVCDTKDRFKVGDIVAFFPPDILIPESIAAQLGVDIYLKKAIYPGDNIKSRCRVSAVRLRGVPSFGFVVPLKWSSMLDVDLNGRFHGVKYEPEERTLPGDCAPGNSKFQVYTDIENYRNRRFKDAIPEGTLVRITEKIHGTNSRIGLIEGQLLVGSHRTIKKPDSNSLYYKPLESYDIEGMLQCLSCGVHDVIVFGEIYGSKIQNMDYGVEGANGYRIFDISVGGIYLNWFELEAVCRLFKIPLVPLLYTGPFNNEVVTMLVDGPTTLTDNSRSKFKGREGCVITPLVEQYSTALCGRMILKAVSVDYLETRKSDSH